ncbi:MAG: acetate--CoA ligase family protein [Candidatus Jordarchaeales archaeon]
MNNLRALFRPSSIAVVGASRSKGKVGYEILRNIVEGGYPGKIFPVNPNADQILGLPCYPSVESIGEEVELAVVVVPAKLVPEVAEDCGKAGVKCLVVISAGFKETGYEGAKLENQLVSIVREYGMRMLGPNVVGVADTHTPLNATFAAKAPLKGNIAFASQSGAMLTSILDWSMNEGIGFSKIVSLGNKADIDETDILEFLAEDEETRVILMYLEDVKRGGEFFRKAKNAVRKKPVIILKSGRSVAGSRAVASHTGALAGSDRAYTTAFEQIGVIRVDKVEELFDLAVALSKQPLPDVEEVVVVTNAGGPGIVTADACEERKIKLASLKEETIRRLRDALPPASSIYNPVDVLGDADEQRYRKALEIVLEDQGVGGCIVILTPQAMTNSMNVAATIAQISKKHAKPILAVFMGGESVLEANRFLSLNGIPCYFFPERAVSALSGMIKYSKVKRRDYGEEYVSFNVNKDKVKDVLRAARNDGRTVLLAHEAFAVVSAYGIPVPQGDIARSEDEAVEIADKVGYPVAMKVVSPQILHKTEVGGVLLNLHRPEDVRRGYLSILSNIRKYAPHARVYGIYVQRMVEQGKEFIVGMSRDLTWGPMLAFGLGGIYVNLIEDVSFRIAPVTRSEAIQMVKETKAYRLIQGFRGGQPLDLEAILDTILKVSQLSTDFPEINEIDINPLFAYPKGCIALDVKITIEKEG